MLSWRTNKRSDILNSLNLSENSFSNCPWQRITQRPVYHTLIAVIILCLESSRLFCLRPGKTYYPPSLSRLYWISEIVHLQITWVTLNDLNDMNVIMNDMNYMNDGQFMTWMSVNDQYNKTGTQMTPNGTVGAPLFTLHCDVLQTIYRWISNTSMLSVSLFLFHVFWSLRQHLIIRFKNKFSSFSPTHRPPAAAAAAAAGTAGNEIRTVNLI